MGWSHDELIMLRSACLAFWMLPRSGFRLRRKTSSCCCPAHRPRTHSRFTCRGQREVMVRIKESTKFSMNRLLSKNMCPSQKLREMFIKALIFQSLTLKT